MNYISAKGSKLKGSAVAASGKHVDRAIHTPNADPEKSAENIHLVGGDVPLEESVKAVINQYGGKPRSDSVECIEFIFVSLAQILREIRRHTGQRKSQNFRQSLNDFHQQRRTLRQMRQSRFASRRNDTAHSRSQSSD